MKLFIIHGWTYNLEKWQRLTEILKVQGHEPILLKVPGLTADSDKPWTIEDYCGWLEHELKGEENTVVIGHSNGGRIAMNLCVSKPGIIDRLILIDSAGIVDNRLLKNIKLKILKILSKLARPIKNIKPLKKVFYKLIGARDYMEAPPNMRLTMQNMFKADKQFDPTEVRVPTVIIWGKDDTITPLSDGYKLREAIVGSTLHIVDGARHAPMDTHPEQTADLIAEAIK